MQYTTERLRLRPLGIEDTDAVWELVSDEAIGGQLYCGVQRTREEAARLVQGYLDDPDRLPFAVLEGDSGAFAGVLVLRRYGRRQPVSRPSIWDGPTGIRAMPGNC